MIRVTVWNEYTQESGVLKKEFTASDLSQEDFKNYAEATARAAEEIHKVYPDGVLAPICRKLQEDPQIQVTYTTMYEPEYGLPQDLLEQTDVLIWWAHISHDVIPDSLAYKIVERVHRGMGFLVLHSAHLSKPFRYLMGTSGTLKWREGDFCRLWNTCPTHPIAAGISEYVELSEEEMYGEYFDIPKPDDVVFTGWFRGGEVFRSGCTWQRGYGKVFYFQPGHETSPSYNNPEVLQIIQNAVYWAAPTVWRDQLNCPNVVDAPESR